MFWGFSSSASPSGSPPSSPASTVYSGYSSYSSYYFSASEGGLRGEPTSQHNQPSCAFPSWPRRSSLDDAAATTALEQQPATSYVSDDDLFPEVFDDNEADCTPISSPCRSPRIAASMREPQLLMAESWREPSTLTANNHHHHHLYNHHQQYQYGGNNGSASRQEHRQREQQQPQKKHSRASGGRKSSRNATKTMSPIKEVE